MIHYVLIHDVTPESEKLCGKEAKKNADATARSSPFPRVFVCFVPSFPMVFLWFLREGCDFPMGKTASLQSPDFRGPLCPAR